MNIHCKRDFASLGFVVCMEQCFTVFRLHSRSASDSIETVQQIQCCEKNVLASTNTSSCYDAQHMISETVSRFWVPALLVWQRQEQAVAQPEGFRCGAQGFSQLSWRLRSAACPTWKHCSCETGACDDDGWSLQPAERAANE